MIFERDTWYMNKARGLYHHPYPRKRARPIPPQVLKTQIADWEKRLALSRPKHKQLKHLIAKLGGILPFSLAVGAHPNYILWNWLGVSKNHTLNKKQRYGMLSMFNLIRVLKFARHFGVLLTPEDLFPDLIEGGIVKNPLSHPELREWIREMEPNANMQELENTVALMINPLGI